MLANGYLNPGGAARASRAACGRLTDKNQAAAEFAVDASEGAVTGPGGTVRLEPKVMDVLLMLSRQAGRVVSRNELMDAVWKDLPTPRLKYPPRPPETPD